MLLPLPSVSVVIACHMVWIASSIRLLLALRYKSTAVIFLHAIPSFPSCVLVLHFHDAFHSSSLIFRDEKCISLYATIPLSLMDK